MAAPLPNTVLHAMAHQEGWFASGPANRPQRNLNPLDLQYCPEAVEFGATGSDGRFAIFPDAETGWNAGRRWLSVPAKFSGTDLVGGYLGATIEQAIYRFAPPSENDSAAYCAAVCEQTGKQPGDVLDAEALG